jgi:hypothetical protein
MKPDRHVIEGPKGAQAPNGSYNSEQ